MKRIATISALGLLFLGACKSDKKEEKKDISVTVTNELGFDRTEIVSIDAEELRSKFSNIDNKDYLHVKDSAGEILRHQWIDYDGDGKADEYLFQASAKASGKNSYTLFIDSTASMPDIDEVAFSRFVPERTDDYAWENDKVAFRTYGPTGQKEAKEGVPGSTLSSGIDLWLKRTTKPVIDKWYAEHVKNPGYYHTDHGEGYDPYHVGDSRGIAGSGVYEDDSLYVSENFIEYKTIAEGPLKTVFELTYAPWGPYNVKEVKRISLPLGSNFMRFDTKIEADDNLPNYAAGISLHNNKGSHQVDDKEGWAIHWEEIDSSHVGEAIVLNPKHLQKGVAHVTDVPDQSNLLMLIKPAETVTYYAGFAWDKSGDIKNERDWKKMVDNQAKIIDFPLKVKID